MRKTLLAAACGLATCSAPAEEKPPLKIFPSAVPPETPQIWNLEELRQTPAVYPVEGHEELIEADGIRPIFFDGLPVDGRPTRVFAWLGIPPAAKGERQPAMVLVHGGGGTAFRGWVKLWMDRGYIAIAMDTNGEMPLTMEHVDPAPKAPHEFAAIGSGNGFGQSLLPLDQQWGYHAVASIVRAHSLLRSLPEVDPQRIGLTGISWGGILTELAASVDDRFVFAAPVYGSGFLGENSLWLETTFQDQMSPAMVERWIALWDPSQHVGRIRLPMLFCNGTNDPHFRPDTWQRTYRAVKGPITLSLKLRMPHGHAPAGDPMEVTVYADSFLKGGAPLARITERKITNGEASVVWESDVPVVRAELLYTKDAQKTWVDREWQVAEAELDGSNRAWAKIPDGTTACFLNTIDERGCVVSGEHWDLLNPSTDR